MPLPNLISANTFYGQFGAKPPNLKTTNISSYMVFQGENNMYLRTQSSVLINQPGVLILEVSWEVQL